MSLFIIQCTAVQSTYSGIYTNICTASHTYKYLLLESRSNYLSLSIVNNNLPVISQLLVGLKTKRYLIADIGVRALCYVTLLAQDSLVEVNSSGEYFHLPSG